MYPDKAVDILTEVLSSAQRSPEEKERASQVLGLLATVSQEILETERDPRVSSLFIQESTRMLFKLYAEPDHYCLVELKSEDGTVHNQVVAARKQDVESVD